MNIELPERVEGLEDLAPLYAVQLQAVHSLPSDYLDACASLLDHMETATLRALTCLTRAGQSAEPNEYADILDALHAVERELTFLRETQSRLTWRNYREEVTA